MLFDWRTLDFHHSIFPRRETDQVSGALFLLSSVIKVGQILLIGSIHFGFFLLISIEICQKISLISIT